MRSPHRTTPGAPGAQEVMEEGSDVTRKKMGGNLGQKQSQTNPLPGDESLAMSLPDNLLH